jgi:hypothetical protein
MLICDLKLLLLMIPHKLEFNINISCYKYSYVTYTEVLNYI